MSTLYATPEVAVPEGLPVPQRVSLHANGQIFLTFAGPAANQNLIAWAEHFDAVVDWTGGAATAQIVTANSAFFLLALMPEDD